MKNKICIKLFLVMGIFFLNILTTNAYQNYTFSYLNNLRPDVADALEKNDFNLAWDLLTSHFSSDHWWVGNHTTNVSLWNDNLFYLTCANTIWILATVSQPVTTYENSNYSCNYISWWTWEWSNCNISSRWSNNGTINCTQNYIYTTPQYSSKNWSCTKKYIEWNYISESCNWSCPSDIPKPNNLTYIRKLSSYIDNSQSNNTCNGSIFADNISSCNIRIDIKWDIEWWKIVEWLLSKNIININNLSTEIKTNQIENTWWLALNFSQVNNTTIKPNWTNFYYEINWIKSLTPFFSSNWRILLQMESFSWVYDNVQISNINYNFNKPFVGEIETLWSSWLYLWTEQTVLIKALPQVDISSFSWIILSNIKNTLIPFDTSKYLIQNIWDENSSNLFSKINFTLNYSWVEHIWSTQITTKPHISYYLDWNEIKYNLTPTYNSSDYNAIKTSNSQFIGVSIYWNSKTIWRKNITSEESSFFTDLSVSKQRSMIKKNITQLLMWREPDSNNIINWILYVTWNYILWDALSDVKTVVIKDWNLVIDKNINKKIWIISIRTHYNNTSIWNIYVNPDVSYINAIIYADGWFISSWFYNNQDKVENYTDSIFRTARLNKQLVFKGSLFTRNTIWWALATNNEYILPWWRKVSALQKNYNEAIMYDLNYIRRWNNWYDNVLWTKKYNNWDISPFVIIYEAIWNELLPGFFITD